MPAPLPDDKRAAILADIKAGKARNVIARKHGVSPSTVTKIAKSAGATDAFDRSQTKRATEAAQADNAALRAIVSRRFLEKANDLLDQMDRPYRVFSFGGKDNTYREQILDRPPAGELRNLMTAAAIALDKHLAIDKHNSGADADRAASLLGAILNDLQARHGDTPSK